MSHVRRHTSTRVMHERDGPSVAPAIPVIPPIVLLVICSVNVHLDSSQVRLRLGGLHPPYNWHRSAFFDARNPAIVRLVALVLPYTTQPASPDVASCSRHASFRAHLVPDLHSTADP